MPPASDSQRILDPGLLLEVADALARGLDETEVGACIAKAAGAMFPGSVIRLWGVAEDGVTRYILAEHGLRHALDHRPLGPGEGLASRSQERQQVIYSADVTTDPGFSKKDWARSEELVSALVLPLSQGTTGVGTLAVFTREPHQFSDEERRGLEVLAAHATLAVVNARLGANLRRKSRQLAELIGVGAEVADTQHLEDALSGIATRAARLLACDGAGVRLVEEGRLVVRSAEGLATQGMTRRVIALGEGVAGQAGAEMRPVIIADTHKLDPAVRDDNPGLMVGGVRAVLAVPACKGGALIAVLMAYSNEPRVFRDDQVVLASAFADLAAVVIEHARLFEASERELLERQSAEAELRRHRDDLEVLVRERTAELEDSHARLLRQERLATLGQLTGTVSHELRNPLGTIRNSLELARVRLGDSRPDVNRAIERGIRNVTRCDRIIGDLLDFARIRAPERQHMALDVWLEDLVRDVSRDADVRLEPAGENAMEVSADPEQLRRAVVNLVDNALQAMGADASGAVASAPVTLGLCVDAGRIGIRVVDTGCGIPDEVRPQVFEPLFSTKSFGVGLGLPYVRQIVEAHGGSLDVNTTPGAGTCITLWLTRSGR